MRVPTVDELTRAMLDRLAVSLGQKPSPMLANLVRVIAEQQVLVTNQLLELLTPMSKNPCAEIPLEAAQPCNLVGWIPPIARVAPQPIVKKPLKPYCRYCQKDLVPELDAYYGKDERGERSCGPCRKIRGIK
jgi:hypothetical protein